MDSDTSFYIQNFFSFKKWGTFQTSTEAIFNLESSKRETNIENITKRLKIKSEWCFLFSTFFKVWFYVFPIILRSCITVKKSRSLYHSQWFNLLSIRHHPDPLGSNPFEAYTGENVNRYDVLNKFFFNN